MPDLVLLHKGTISIAYIDGNSVIAGNAITKRLRKDSALSSRIGVECKRLHLLAQV